MNIQQQTFEGTWEEVLLQADKLAGRRVRLIVLNDQTESTASLEQLLQGRVGKVSFQPSDLSENTGKVFTEIVSDKHRGNNP